MTFPTSSARVVSLGAHIVDILGRPVTGIPQGQGHLLLDEIRVTAAGTAAGTSVDLVKLGAEVVAMGAIDDDELGDFLILLMSRRGIDTSRLARKHGVQTSATILPIRPNGERPALHVPGASPWLELADVDLDAVACADVLHVGAPDVLGGFAGEALGRILEFAKAHDVIVTMDLLQPGEVATLDMLRPLLPLVDYFMPNAEQLCAVTGAAGCNDAVGVIKSICSATVVVKMGADGSLVAGDGPPIQVPALPVEVVDTTGCGDAYSAGFIVALARGWEVKAAAWFGAAAAARVAQGLGSDAGIVDFSDTAGFLAAFGPTVGAIDFPAEVLEVLLTAGTSASARKEKGFD